MAIRFRCEECNHLLSIASRKAGTVIECPICAAAQIVPDEETARALLHKADLRPTEAEPENDVANEEDGLIILDELTDLAASGPPLASEARATVEPPPALEPKPSEPELPLLPGDLVLLRRKWIYIQGVAFVLVSILSLVFGLAIGRVSTYFSPVHAGASAHGNAGDAAESPQMFIDGRLVYATKDGKFTGDEDAVAVFLPEGKRPVEPISISGLRPQDPTPNSAHAGLRRIEELGGIYVRADSDGNFHAVLPRVGKYYLLLISRHANRPQDSSVDEVDREESGKYFSRPVDLIGRSKYRWTLENLRPGSPPVNYSFGGDAG